MKGKKFYVILAGLLVIGIASVFLYREQQEARVLEFEGYGISEIEERVTGLYNEEKTDISENISTEELKNIEGLFVELKDQTFSGRNEQRLKEAELDFLTASDMKETEEKINKLFVDDDIIEADISTNDVEQLEQEIETYEMKTIYYERNVKFLEDASIQISDINTATEFIEALFDNDLVREDISREDEEEALELIEPIRNTEIKEELSARVEVVSLALTEMEEALALQEEIERLEAEEEAEEELLDEDEMLEEEEVEYTAPPNDWNSGSSTSGSSSSGANQSSGNWNSGSNSGGNTGNNWTPPSQSTPDPEPEPETNPEPEETPEDEEELEEEEQLEPEQPVEEEGENPTWESQR